MKALSFQEKVTLRHSLSTYRTKVPTRRMCQPCVTGKHPGCNLDTCCCVCNEVVMSEDDNKRLQHYYCDPRKRDRRHRIN